MNQLDDTLDRESTDRKLTELLAADLDSNFEEVVLAYQHRLYSYVRFMVGNEPDAEDMIQDTFVNAYQALRRYSESEVRSLKLKPWLYKIAHNLVLNHIRYADRSSQSKEISIDRAELGESLGLIEQDQYSLPEQVLESNETREELYMCLNRLSASNRTPVILHYISGLPYHEIAVILNQPVNTVKSNGRRGLISLQQMLRMQRTIKEKKEEVQ